MFKTMKYFYLVVIIHSALGMFLYDDHGIVVAEAGSSRKIGDLPELRNDVAKKLDDAFDKFIVDLKNSTNTGKKFFVDTNGVSVFLTVKLGKAGKNIGVQDISVAAVELENEGFSGLGNTMYTPISSLEETRTVLKEFVDQNPEYALNLGFNYMFQSILPALRNKLKLVDDASPFGFRARLVKGFDTVNGNAKGIYLAIGAVFFKKEVVA